MQTKLDNLKKQVHLSNCIDILMKQSLNIHHSMYLEDNEDFNNILNSYINTLKKNMKENM